MADAGDENFTPLDVTTLTEQQAHDYRQELVQALLNPGIEFDLVGGEGERDEKLYAA
jgi:phosphatidate phosphatase APP1